MELLLLLKTLSWLSVAGIVWYISFWRTRWVESQRVRRKLGMQGIKGPPPSFLYGNVAEMQQIQFKAKNTRRTHTQEIVAHDYTSTLFPYFDHWRKEYG
ncbi:cytochrome P450 [Corchorus capsularis]|uniref:Cytochrome P450 n=1 Tax=Corchorus capsularis TaxID=210143 RepID=A0A1R3IU82_COCAP|nr:cytochrome P450 [Corchorus capsularis]